jgi:hypothetical protein
MTLPGAAGKRQASSGTDLAPLVVKRLGRSEE